jgi:HD-GYP domain-containing protein (c-di-GMP phosphodiesterase class II)
MTTTRPYRMAMSIQEALHRLEDAAGTQLDPRLVKAFVNGIETAENAPLPGDGRPLRRIWTPQSGVA